MNQKTSIPNQKYSWLFCIHVMHEIFHILRQIYKYIAFWRPQAVSIINVIYASIILWVLVLVMEYELLDLSKKE